MTSATVSQSVITAAANATTTILGGGANVTTSAAPVAWRGIDLTWVTSKPALIAAGITSLIAIVLATRDIRAHTQKYERPRLQRPIIRLLFMLPFYGVLSFASLLLPEMRFVLLTIRDSYEAFALYQFMSLMVAYAGGEGQLIYALEQKRYKGLHLYPCCCLPLFKLNRDFFLRCKRLILQYALIKPSSSFLALTMTPLGLYREASYEWFSNLYPWLMCINNVSISYALYYLVLFEIECERELAYCKAGIKFLCIKSIIFFAFWQSWLIGILIPMGLFYMGDTPEEQEFTTATLLEWLICIELAPISITHHFAFNVRRLEDALKDAPAYESSQELSAEERKGAFDEALSLQDVVKDTIATIFYRKGALIGGGDVDDDDGASGEGRDSGGDRGGDRGDGNHGGTEVEMRKVHLQEEYDILQSKADVVDSDSDEEGGDVAADDAGWADNVAMALPPMPAFLSNVFNLVMETTGLKGDEPSGVNGGGPAVVYCVVCGRNDRDMVQRKSGWKCKECVGAKHQYNAR